MAKKESGSLGAILAVGAAAAAAGAYFLYGSKGAKKNRAVVKGWALKVKGEVLEKMETVKELDEEAYNKVVDAVSSRYKAVDPKELKALVTELKSHWKSIQKEIGAGKKSVAKAVVKTVKNVKNPPTK